ncbi:MAG: copper homeostasis protein CutC [Acidobacteriia bacterium]|nr:copper homeostasis protein CutC [Terriglobia bacterium]
MKHHGPARRRGKGDNEGGASSLEVCVQLDRAGLTPPLRLVQEIVQRVPIPARVMLRERDDFVLSGPKEVATLQNHRGV